MARAKRTDAALQEASNHLHYEFSMLTSVAHAIASGMSSNGWLLNALLESFVIHFRALLDFFYPAENPKQDDVLAKDYFDDGGWDKIKPKLSDALAKEKVRAHKEIAHLTYARLNVTPETKNWAFIDIANEMNAVMEVFLKHVPKARLGSRWHDK